ncbi:MAG: spore coat protein [Clostridia bacterium]|nr:spore coat protein [Clostridia bacterium]
MDYKTEVTLNEKDTIVDMLILEKNLAKTYAEILTEGCSKGFLTTIKDCMEKTFHDQFKTFMLLTECGYYRVHSATEEEIKNCKKKFDGVESLLY